MSLVFSIWRSLRCSTVHSAAGLVTISQCALISGGYPFLGVGTA